MNMKARNRRVAIAAAALAVVGTSAGVSIASGTGDDAETNVGMTGQELDRASQVALEYLGEGRVTGTEVGDEESYYEVEVTLDDGTQVDVQLDANYNVVSGDADIEDDD
jgi:uncharacterized membrane protein YkoI